MEQTREVPCPCSSSQLGGTNTALLSFLGEPWDFCWRNPCAALPSSTRALIEWEKSSEHPQESLQHQRGFQHSLQSLPLPGKGAGLLSSTCVLSLCHLAERGWGSHLHALEGPGNRVGNKSHKQRSPSSGAVWILPNESPSPCQINN